MPKETNQKSKNQVIRERRKKQQARQRMLLIAAVAGIALVVTGLLVLPNILNSMRPVGEVVQITPGTKPEGEGKLLGDPNAPVKIEVFEDFQCPACRDFSERVEPQIIDNLVKTGKASYEYMHFAFLDDQQIAKESDQAANASMCAADQGRFWDYHDIVYANWDGENGGAFSDKRLVAFAEALELDMDTFNTCFEENPYKAQIDAEFDLGKQYGVQGTPSVAVNGKLIALDHVPTFQEIEAAVNAATP